MHCLTYGSIISAVDPVAVLAVFEAVRADKDLYYLVLGEALFNDGVTFVLFQGLVQMARVRSDDIIPASSYFYVLSFMFIAPIGGMLVGIVCGCLCAFLTKYSTNESELFQISLIMTSAFLAYYSALCIGFSSVIGLIACGLTQQRYAVPNLTPENQMTTRTITRAVSHLCEMLLFILLGVETTHIQITRCYIFFIFVFLTITLWRFVVTFSLISVINVFRRYKPITYDYRTIMFIGGLRGAFSFVMNLEYDGAFKLMFHDATLLIIIITNIINGIVAKPLIHYMKLEEPPSPKDQTFNNLISYLGDIVRLGVRSVSTSQETYQSITIKLLNFERDYIFKLLCKNNSGQERLIRDFDMFEQEEALKMIENHSMVRLLKTQILLEKELSNSVVSQA